MILSEILTAIKPAVLGWITPINGTYTPTLTNVTNIDASTPLSCLYWRAGNTVHVSAAFNVDPTAAGTIVLGVSLPIASNITDAADISGTAAGLAGYGVVIGNAASDRADIYITTSSTVNTGYHAEFTYQVK